MIKIIKDSQEPTGLKDFKHSCFDKDLQKHINCSYNHLPKLLKSDLKTILLKEQFYLCAYCNKEIKEDVSSIEHWYAQNACKILATYNTPQGEDINYFNLIVVCTGNHGNPNFLHCDKERAKLTKYDQILTIKPHGIDYNFGGTFSYEAGRLVSNNSAIQDDVNRKLNLNHQTLINYRNIAFDQFIKNLAGRKDSETMKQQLQRYSTPNSAGRLRKYCSVITYFINKKLQSS